MREKREITKIDRNIALRLRLREQAEGIPAYGQLATDGNQHHAIAVTDTNDIILIFGSSSVAFFCLTDLSGKLLRVFKAEPGKQETDATVSEVQPRFEEEMALWRTYLGLVE